MDNVLIWGKTQEHDTHLHTVLKRIQCDLSKSEVKLLGHILSAEGIWPDPNKTESIVKMEPTTNISEERSFLGMVNK